MNGAEQPATKGDLARLKVELTEEFDGKLQALSDRFDDKLEALSDRFDAKLLDSSNRVDVKLQELSETFDAKLEDMKDQIIRAIQMTEENIRGHAAHVDEVADLSRRVSRVEDKLGIREQ